MKKVLLVLVVLIGGFAAFVATRPAHFDVQRAATIHAPPDVVYQNIIDFHEWSDWSPWDKLDPQQKTTITGPDRAVGSFYTWKGNDKVGEGSMKITEAVPSSRVVIDLEFLKPMKMQNTTTFTLAPAGADTQVTWSMAGDSNFVGKLFGIFMNTDKMIGADFERGLAGLETDSVSDHKKAVAMKAAEEAKAAAAAVQNAAPTIPAAGAPAAMPAPVATPAPAAAPKK